MHNEVESRDMLMMTPVKLTIGDMRCGSCIKRLSALLGATEAVEILDVAIGSAEVVLNLDRISPQALVDTLADAGYSAQVVEDENAESLTCCGSCKS